MNEQDIAQSTKQLIDALKQSCGAVGLGNDGNEYKIIVQVFLYKYFNDKFGYEAKRNPKYGARFSAASTWDIAYDGFPRTKSKTYSPICPPPRPGSSPTRPSRTSSTR